MPRNAGTIRAGSASSAWPTACSSSSTVSVIPTQPVSCAASAKSCMFADLEIVSNRIDRLQDQLKKPRPAKQKEQDQLELALLQRIATAFEQNISPTKLGLKEEEEKAIRSFQLLTLKPELVLLNIGDDRLKQPVPADLLALAPNTLQAPAHLELELGELAPEDREMMMQEYGVKGSAHDDVLRSIFYAMGMQVFFTVGEDECRAWSMPKGADAVIGASQIHTDLAKGFVRAEVVSYADFQQRRLHEGSKNPRRLSTGRQDLHRPGRRHHAHPGREMTRD